MHFVIIHNEEEGELYAILGRPFLRTARENDDFDTRELRLKF